MCVEVLCFLQSLLPSFLEAIEKGEKLEEVQRGHPVCSATNETL